MSKKSKKRQKPEKEQPGGEDLRLEPEKRVSNKFDGTSIAEFPVAGRNTMGLRVRDNCAEEHIM